MSSDLIEAPSLSHILDDMTMDFLERYLKETTEELVSVFNKLHTHNAGDMENLLSKSISVDQELLNGSLKNVIYSTNASGTNITCLDLINTYTRILTDGLRKTYVVTEVKGAEGIVVKFESKVVETIK